METTENKDTTPAGGEPDGTHHHRHDVEVFRLGPVAAGDVRSDVDTIAALRQGVPISRRICTMTVAGHDGLPTTLPLAVQESDQGIKVEVLGGVLAEVDKRASGPRRRVGTIELGSVASLVDYVNRFAKPTAEEEKAGAALDAVAFAPLNPPGVTVIIDYHPAGRDQTSWGEERAAYRCAFSRQWKAWTGMDGKPFSQADFVDFLDANVADLTTKDGLASATVMIDTARNLAIHSKGTFNSAINQRTGERALVVKDEHDTQTSTPIPAGFALSIPVFEGDTNVYLIEAQLRFKLEEGKNPRFTFVLQNKDVALEHALEQIRARVRTECGIPVYVGTAPAGAR